MISFVILHYQAIDETISCIDTIVKKVKGKKKIIVVDNFSPNASGKSLVEIYRDSELVSVVLSEKNLGFAKGNNIGFKEAKKDEPEFIVVMNNDVFIQQDDFTNRVYSVFDECKFDILGPDIYSTRVNNHQNPQRENNYSLKELEKARKKMLFKDKNKWMLKIKYLFPSGIGQAAEIEHFTKERKEGVVLHGACYIYSRRFIENHDKCFFNSTFMYFESYILHYLAQKENLLMIYEPSIVVLHHEDIATNLSYRSGYSKAIFVNRCLLDSCEVFIDLMKNENKRE